MKDRFLLADGSPDMPALKEWAEEYYQTLMGMVNGFYAQADIQDVIESLRNIPFQQLVSQELTDAGETIVGIAITFVKEIAEREIDYIRAYLKYM
ncbi:MAG TPA: hypothetical protein P5309_10530 [Syntrophomonadaceae bacterium]|jgi:hypothetical protein|nr:hypothetical protein [Syntrophomonadaceae bacterium]